MIADPAVRRHLAACARPIQAVSLHEIGFVANQGCQDCRQILRSHLSIARHDDRRFYPELQSYPATRGDGGAHTSVLGVDDELDVTGSRFDQIPRTIVAAIVDDDDPVHETGNPFERSDYEPRFVIRWNHHGNRQSVEHASAVAIVSRRDGQPLARRASQA